MDNHYLITKMTREEFDITLNWVASEDNPGLYDGDCFYQTDPNGFFVGKLDGKNIAFGSAVIYDEFFAFCGFYVVHPNYRGQGYGLALTKERLKYIGNRNAGIDAVLEMADKFENIGYRAAHLNQRYVTINPCNRSKDSSIIQLNLIDFNELNQFDRLFFPAPRPGFLKRWISQPDSNALGYYHDKKLLGYGVIRRCRKGYKIGPLFALDDKVAEQLFLALVYFAGNAPVFMDVPENNLSALELMRKYRLKKVYETKRMYLKGPPKINTEGIFALTSIELG